MTWILILVITSNAPAIGSVPGFASKDECERAGQAWIEQIDKRRRAGNQFDFACVEQTRR